MTFEEFKRVLVLIVIKIKLKDLPTVYFEEDPFATLENRN